MTASYLTVAAPARVEMKRKGSHFIGDVARVNSREEVTDTIDRIQKAEHSATHHCFAWNLAVGGKNEFKYSDDGEPKGTAGKPIYDVLKGRNLTNTLVVVTRYFGGTKLGVGPLARAYKDTATAALDTAGVTEIFPECMLSVRTSFSVYGRLQELLEQCHGRVVEGRFTDVVSLSVTLRELDYEFFVRSLTEISAGSAIIQKISQ